MYNYLKFVFAFCPPPHPRLDQNSTSCNFFELVNQNHKCIALADCSSIFLIGRNPMGGKEIEEKTRVFVYLCRQSGFHIYQTFKRVLCNIYPLIAKAQMRHLYCYLVFLHHLLEIFGNTP